MGKETSKRTTLIYGSVSGKIGGVFSGQELRNSKSTAVSRQRKEVYSKTRFINEHGVAVTQRQEFIASIPLSPTSSKASADLNPLAKLQENNKKNEPRVSTAVNNVARQIRIEQF